MLYVANNVKNTFTVPQPMLRASCDPMRLRREANTCQSNC